MLRDARAVEERRNAVGRDLVVTSWRLTVVVFTLIAAIEGPV